MKLRAEISQLKSYRETCGISLLEMAQRLDIKLPYLRALERGQWAKLPAPCYVRSYARKYLAITKVGDQTAEQLAKAIKQICETSLREKISARSASQKFKLPNYFSFQLGPLALIAGVILIAGYLSLQAYAYVNGPFLQVQTPQENFVSPQPNIKIQGRADLNSAVFINDLPISLGKDGTFVADLKLQPGENDLHIAALDTNKHEHDILRHVIYESAK